MAEIIHQHVIEASLLWERRDEATGAPHYRLADLAAIDDRLEANLDGLLEAGEQTWRSCDHMLEWANASDVFTGSYLAFLRRDPFRIEQMLEFAADPARARGLTSALAWLPQDAASDAIAELTRSADVHARRIGWRASSLRRQVEPGFLAAPQSDDVPDQLLWLRVVGESGSGVAGGSVIELARSGPPEVQGWAAWTLGLLGHPESGDLLRDRLEDGVSDLPWIAELSAACFAFEGASVLVEQLMSRVTDPRLLIQLIGRFGYPEQVPLLIEKMDDPATARVAGEAFAWITGADLDLLDLEAEPPQDLEFGPTEDPSDDDVEMDPDEDLPWPDPKLVAAWWSEHRTHFGPGHRYLYGRPHCRETYDEMLRSGTQRLRAAAAIELRRLDHGRPLFEIRAPGLKQQQLLGLDRMLPY